MYSLSFPVYSGVLFSSTAQISSHVKSSDLIGFVWKAISNEWAQMPKKKTKQAVASIIIDGEFPTAYWSLIRKKRHLHEVVIHSLPFLAQFRLTRSSVFNQLVREYVGQSIREICTKSRVIVTPFSVTLFKIILRVRLRLRRKAILVACHISVLFEWASFFLSITGQIYSANDQVSSWWSWWITVSECKINWTREIPRFKMLDYCNSMKCAYKPVVSDLVTLIWNLQCKR